MARKVAIFIAGLVVGVLLMGVLVYMALPRMMLRVHRSALDFDSTVTSIENAAESHEWKVPKIYDIQGSIVSAGHADMTRLKVISLCHPHHAYTLLSRDENKFVAGIMPCRVAVYEATDGIVYISELDMGRLAGLFGGEIGEVMNTISGEQERMFSHLYVD
jgi:uncharacterized protein (DUF302 family)